MQEAFMGGRAHESHLSAQGLISLRDLNRRFLDLAAARGYGHREGRSRPSGLSSRLAPLSAAQREAAAGCPYALFDLRFQDDRHWRSRLQEAGAWRADAVSAALPGDDTIDFARLALFYAWHVASGATLKAQILLGMNEDTADALRRITVNQLPLLVASEAKYLSARFSDCAAFWNALTSAASATDSAALKRVQLYGLQIAAAARLPAL
ncbi:MAG TPA: hypothetical protein VHZ53_03430 [Steroidobacteraceae bacterium]|jgi:hypothetical protein|nr:hypothetical protein [Steroidobacteraceae bacterium]